jgi:hypothetical protein
MTAEAASYAIGKMPEPFTVVPVLLEDGRLTWAVWTGWRWWGEHQWLPVVRWDVGVQSLREVL